MHPAFLAIAALLLLNGCGSAAEMGTGTGTDFTILVFSKTVGFRHDSIPDGIELVKRLAAANHFAVETSEDSSLFTDGNLSRYRAVVFLNTTGDVLESSQENSFQRYIESGGGFVGIHSASDTEHGWPWYGRLVGALFQDHPAVQMATIRVEDPKHSSTAMLGTTWDRTDEWYNFDINPRGQVRVLASLDESSYFGGTMGDHPIAWCQRFDGGRSWYTAGGHTRDSYTEPLYEQHVLGGIQYAAGIASANCE
jgi:type 1 glutamine amidotransferase